MTLVKALLTHCKIDKESLTEFRQQFSRLDDADKAWFKEQFKVEFKYDID